MSLQEWRSRVIAELRRQRLPERNVERLADELTEHAIDALSADENPSSEQDLDRLVGEPHVLAAVAKSEFKKNGIASRNPLLVFLIGPIFAVYGSLLGLIVVAALASCVGGLISPRFAEGRLESPEQAAVAYRICQLVSLTLRFFPFVLSSWIFAKLSVRNGHRVWGFVACGIIAVSAFYLRSVAQLQTRPDHRVFVVCDVIAIPQWNLTQITQAAVPLLVGGWIYWQSRKSALDRASVLSS